MDASSDMNDLAEVLLRGGQPEGATPVQGTFFRQFLPASHTVSSCVLFPVQSLYEIPTKPVPVSYVFEQQKLAVCQLN